MEAKFEHDVQSCAQISNASLAHNCYHFQSEMWAFEVTIKTLIYLASGHESMEVLSQISFFTLVTRWKWCFTFRPPSLRREHPSTCRWTSGWIPMTCRRILENIVYHSLLRSDKPLAAYQSVAFASFICPVGIILAVSFLCFLLEWSTSWH